MKVTRFLLSALFLGAMATTASAQGIASISWDNCTPPVSDAGRNKQVLPGSQVATNSLYASVIQHSAPHNGYEVQVLFYSPAPGIRDAWRFDSDGCQGSAFITIDHIAPAAVVKVCPSFSGTASVLQIKGYTYEASDGRATGLVANAYPAGNPNALNPAQRYFLARFGFDHSFSVNGPTTPGADCGGLEVPVCAWLKVAKYNALTGGEIDWLKGNDFLMANDPNNTNNCPGVVPAKNTTWGKVKSQYKH
jgi:hypothetical protein